MIVRTEGNFEGHDGSELFYQTWTASEARATLVVTHGISEHSESYDRCFAKGMCGRGYNVIGWDLRGHGRSHGKRGYIDAFKTYSEDLSAFIRFLEGNGRLSLPYALVSHSMGGLISMRYLIDHGSRGAAALCLSSPLLGISVVVPPVKDFAARLLNRVAPTFTMYNEVRYEDLTRDAEMLKTYPKDPLRHEKISPSLYFSMLEMIEYVRAKGDAITIPVLMQIAGVERIVSRTHSEEFFPTLGSKNKKLIVYEDSLHEIFNDLDREKVFSDMDAFLKPLLTTRGS